MSTGVKYKKMINVSKERGEIKMNKEEIIHKQIDYIIQPQIKLRDHSF